MLPPLSAPAGKRRIQPPTLVVIQLIHVRRVTDNSLLRVAAAADRYSCNGVPCAPFSASQRIQFMAAPRGALERRRLCWAGGGDFRLLHIIFRAYKECGDFMWRTSEGVYYALGTLNDVFARVFVH